MPTLDDIYAELTHLVAEVAAMRATEPARVAVEHVVITTGQPLPAANIAAAAAAAGFDAAELPTAVAVALAESAGYPKAVGGPNRDGTYDCGLWQINDTASPTQQERFEPDANARAARRVYLASGWQAWTVYTTGAYQRRMAAAEAAVHAYRLR